MKETNLMNRLDGKSEFHVVAKPKLKISKLITTKMTESNIGMDELAERIGVKSKDILEITSGENYKINVLLKVADELDIELFNFEV